MPKLLKLLILYYSQTGNTGAMARAVAEGAKSVPGVNVENWEKTLPRGL